MCFYGKQKKLKKVGQNQKIMADSEKYFKMSAEIFIPSAISLDCLRLNSRHAG